MVVAGRPAGRHRPPAPRPRRDRGRRGPDDAAVPPVRGPRRRRSAAAELSTDWVGEHWDGAAERAGRRSRWRSRPRPPASGGRRRRPRTPVRDRRPRRRADGWRAAARADARRPVARDETACGSRTGRPATILGEVDRRRPPGDRRSARRSCRRAGPARPRACGHGSPSRSSSTAGGSSSRSRTPSRAALRDRATSAASRRERRRADRGPCHHPGTGRVGGRRRRATPSRRAAGCSRWRR